MRASLLAVTGLAVVACAPAPRAPSAPDRASRVTEGLLPVVHVAGTPLPRYRLAERMAHYHVPGITIAVADGGAIAWARGFGVVREGAAQPVTERTLFQAGSISKPVTATAMLRLVEGGTLSLDRDVNAYLQSWKVPETELTAKEKVTLRRIVSHSAGTTVHGFPGYAPGAPLPTLPQILDGLPPANTRPVRVDAVPGERSRYSGGGVTIEQLVLVETTGKPFPALMQELVLGPLGMRDSTFEQPLSGAWAPSAATAHDGSGHPLAGGCHVYPEMAAAGLWTTPTDLLRWSIGIADARSGRPGGVLSARMAAEMLTPQKPPFGLGPVVGGEGPALHFGHPGEDEGFLSEVRYYPETGRGAAVMVNAAGGRALLAEVLEAIASEYGWPDERPNEVAAVAVEPALRGALPGTYEAAIEAYHVEVRITDERGRLHVVAPILGLDSDVVFTAPKTMTALDGGEELEVVAPAPGKVTAVRFGDWEITRRP